MALNINRMTAAGRVIGDPEVRRTGSGDKQTVNARFSLSISRDYKKEGAEYPETDVITVTTMGKKAEFVEGYIKKGTNLYVEGEWRTGSYTNGDGQKVYTNQLFVDPVKGVIKFTESKNTNSGNAGNNAAPAAQPVPEDNGSDVGDFSDADPDCPW